MSFTLAACGSSIVCTPMKCGPTTFQWMCLSVSPRSIRETSRAWRMPTSCSLALRSRPAGRNVTFLAVLPLPCAMGVAFRTVRCLLRRTRGAWDETDRSGGLGAPSAKAAPWGRRDHERDPQPIPGHPRARDPRASEDGALADCDADRGLRRSLPALADAPDHRLAPDRDLPGRRARSARGLVPASRNPLARPRRTRGDRCHDRHADGDR